MDFTKDISLPEDTYISEKSIFIWMDILGFSNVAENEKEYRKLSEILKAFQGTFNESHDYLTNIISDGIILTIKKESLNKLKEVLQDIGKKQFNFILEKNHFIRGGIAVGTELLSSNNNFISNGLTRSVRIESRYRDWPIIGTDKNNIEEIRKILLTNDNEYFGLMSGHNNTGENIYFIDFMNNINRDEYYYLIENKIKEFESKPRIKNKYLWLLRYFCHKYGDSQIDKSLKEIVL